VQSLLLGHEKIELESKSPLDQLTSMRFFAALYVLVLHSGSSQLVGHVPTWAANFLRNGYLGVSFFFILSGFILTYSYSGREISGALIKTFFTARFARIYPVYFLALLIIAPLSVISAHSISQFFLLQYWMPIRDANQDNWNFPGWTLSVEFFFYLSFPIWLWVTRDLSSGALIALITGCVVLIVALGLPTMMMDKSGIMNLWAAYFPLPILRLPEFLYGVLLARMFQSRPTCAVATPLLATSIVLSIIALSISQSTLAASVASVLFGPIIFFGASDRGSFLRRAMTLRTLVLLGSASYALYILQTPVRSWIRVLFTGDLDWTGRELYYPIVFIVSVTVFAFYEEPVREWIKSAARVTAKQKTPSRISNP
jgi:peptidoglycan/LPS O-acetylase OafA/YrhL